MKLQSAKRRKESIMAPSFRWTWVQSEGLWTFPEVNW